MSFSSPDQRHQASPPDPSSVGDGGESQTSSFSTMNIFSNLAERRNARGEGSQPKRRGPKPDAKPALTRRQELNRQAQRTHRERKEHYVKSLEDEVLRLKAAFTASERERNKQAEDNKRLRDLLIYHGIPIPEAPTGSNGGQTAASHSTTSPWMASQSPGASTTTSGRASSAQHHVASGQELEDMTRRASTTKGIDYNQAGIDFVLTVPNSLERPCMDHLPFLANDSGVTCGHPFGHTLMVSCPTQSWSYPSDSSSSPKPGAAWKSVNPPWEMNKAELSRLLDLSPKKDNDGEVTPIMAWTMLMAHPRFLELDLQDVQNLATELCRRTKCYGFGAVMEEFEIRDSIEDILSQKSSPSVQMSV